MEVTAALKSFIYITASSLLLPVLLLLSAMTIWLVVYSGSFFGMWLARRRLRRPVDAVASIRSGAFSEFPPHVRSFCLRVKEMNGTGYTRPAVLNLIREAEHRLWRPLDRLRILVRTGPGLGLIGTLIPMGTGLASLGQGDLTRLSGDLVVAFTTTVVGMAVGMASYFFLTIQRRWAEEDLKNMELAAELLSGGHADDEERENAP